MQSRAVPGICQLRDDIENFSTTDLFGPEVERRWLTTEDLLCSLNICSAVIYTAEYFWSFLLVFPYVLQFMSFSRGSIFKFAEPARSTFLRRRALFTEWYQQTGCPLSSTWTYIFKNGPHHNIAGSCLFKLPAHLDSEKFYRRAVRTRG